MATGDEGEKPQPHYLLIRRRDSLGYIDFLRGKYSATKRSYIQSLIAGMTRDEMTRLQTLPFDELWTRLWNSQNTRQFRSEYEAAKRAFEHITRTGQLLELIREVTVPWEEPEWGFPKGRRSLHESDMSCAIREFCEETGLVASDLQVRRDLHPEKEDYTGSNGIRYHHCYYIADCEADVEVNLSNKVQAREVGDIGWFSFEEAYLKIRSTNPEKRAVLGRVHARLLEADKE
jgi:8-oxo-dGTP pyrophosphatase MutT (NUDIX family)